MVQFSRNPLLFWGPPVHLLVIPLGVRIHLQPHSAVHRETYPLTAHALNSMRQEYTGTAGPHQPTSVHGFPPQPDHLTD